MTSAGEEAVSASSPDQNLFELKKLISCNNICMSARSEVGRRQLLAFVTGSGDLSLHYLSGEPNMLPIMRHIPWYMDSDKRIAALCFDPSGTWLLIAGYDNSLFLIPALALVDSSTVLDHRWSTVDVTSFPSSTSTINNNSRSSHPVSIVWWQSVLECQHSAILGNDRGDIIFISLTTGTQVGITYIKSPVATLHVCQDNSLDSVFLLITDDKHCQWKLMLEQRATGYSWPTDSIIGGSKGLPSSLDLSSSHSSIDLEFGSRSGTQYPTARSRLRGLKQLSVEKLASLRQRLAETRSKGVSSMGNNSMRRGSSSSSSDDTANSSNKRKSSLDTSYVTTGPIPDKLSVHVGETFLQPQYTRGRYLLSGYYEPSSILTIHGMSLEVVPLFVHKLPTGCSDILVTDRFLFVTNTNRDKLSIVSCQLSESRLDGDMEHNPESIIETYSFDKNEKILAIYKSTECNYQKNEVSKTSTDVNKPEKDELTDSKGQKLMQPKDIKSTKIKAPSVDSCIIVTKQAMYQVNVRRPATEIFLELVLTHQELEKAERLALMFGLNLQELLEHAGDLKLAAKEFPQAIALYKLSRCRHLKSVLKFAAGGHSVELLGYINLLFSTSGLDLTTLEKIHLSNLAVMSYTEQVLRNAAKKGVLFKQFLQFLRENLYYDEVLAVNVAGQTGLWEVLQFLASYRGLHQEMLDILTKIMRSHSDIKAADSDITKLAPALDSGLWLCVTDPTLQQSLLAKPQHAKIHVNFVDTYLAFLEQFALQRLAALYDPSSPSFHFSLRRMFKVLRRRRSSGSSSSCSGHLDSFDLMDSSDELLFPMEHVIQTFLLVLLYLVKKQQPGHVYIPELMKKITVQKEQEDEDVGEMSPTVPLQVSHLSSGFSHVALVRNGAVYTWGNAVQGCLGTGPTMSRYGSPQPISLFSSLMLEVSSVSCGRQHTLALTNNGVYAWGSSQFGQLGIGKTVQSPYPRLVEGLAQERIVAVSCGQYHSAALAHDGRVFTWGWGVHGQLGHSSVEDMHHPSLVKQLVGKVVIQVCGGHGHTVVLTAGGDVYTFGSSVFGQLGNGTNVKSSLPLQVTGLSEPIILIATGYFHNLAVSSSNKLYMWGSSPQALRLQAQAQKKARLLQQQLQMQTSRQEQQQANRAKSSVALKANTCSSEISNHSVSSSDSHEGICEGSPSSQCSEPTVAGNNPANADETTLGCAKPHLESSQEVPSSASKELTLINSSSSEFLNEVQNSSNLRDSNLDSRLEYSQKNTLSEVQDPVIVKSTSLTLDKTVLSGGGSSKKSERLLNQEKNVLMSGNVSNTPSILIDDEDLSKGISDSSNLRADDLDLKSAFSPTLPTIVVSPTVEFKGLSAPSLQTNIFNLAGRAGRMQGDDGQAHLFPQLVDTTLVTGLITQISCGCHHSALLTKEGVLYIWGRNLDGQVGNGSRKEVPIPTPLTSTPTVSMKSPTSMSGVIPSSDFEHLRLQQVCCGCEFTTALEGTGGKVWAWGNNSQAQLGVAPLEDSKPLEGKLVMLKTSKRVIKLPHGMHNSCDVPREVVGVPISNISFQASSRFTNERWPEGSNSSLCPPLCSIEQPCYGPRTLHYTLQHFHGHYDSKHVLGKCLELENYQAAAKLSAMDRNYHIALAYQLKALTLTTVGIPQDGDVSDTECILKPQVEKTCKENSNTQTIETKLRKVASNGVLGNLNQRKESSGRKGKIHNKNKNQKNNIKLSISTSETDLVNKDNLKDSSSDGVCKELASNFKNASADTSADISLPKSKTVVTVTLGDIESREGVRESALVKRPLTKDARSLSVSSTPENVVLGSNPDESEMHTFAIQGGLEQMFEDKPYLTSPESSSPMTSESRTPLQSLNSDSLEGSGSQTPVNIIVTASDKNIDKSTLSKEDSGVSMTSDDQCTFCHIDSTSNFIENLKERLPNSKSLIATSVDCKSKSHDLSSANVKVIGEQGRKCSKSENSLNTNTENVLNDDGKKDSVEQMSIQTRHKDLVARASLVVDYYVTVMEEDSHAMMSQLLQQGFEFWLSHSLPVDHLESLLLKHMSKFFYPLGLLLFCKGNTSSTGEGDVHQDICVLNHLSSRFCLQLCSVLLGHIDQKKACPDYMELLAQLTVAHGVNGCYQGAAQTPEQLMEAILGGLGRLKNPGDSPEQSFVTLNQEGINLCGEDSSHPDQLFIFSCGHQYGSETFRQSVLPELEHSLMQLHRPLSNTACALKSMFNTGASSIQLACPKCLLSYLQAQVT